MSVRPKARSPEPELQPRERLGLDDLEELEDLEDLEELGDEAIIAQQTAAHALQPRVVVSEESRSVVITEHPEVAEPEPPRHPPPRSSAEATVVIRDRRALDEMRRKIVHRQRQKAVQGRNALYFWGALGLAAFVLGGIVAFLATDAHSGSQTAPQSADDPAQLAPHGDAKSLPTGSTKPPALRLGGPAK